MVNLTITPCSCRQCHDFFIEVSYGAAISACENRIAWEPALALLADAKEDLDILMLGQLFFVQVTWSIG